MRLEVDKHSKEAHSFFRTLERTSKGRRDLEPERGLRIKLYVLQGLPGFTVSVSANIKGTWEVRSGKLRPSRVQQGKTKTRCVFPSNLGKGASEAGAIARGGTRVGREVISRIQGKTRRGKRHTESDWRRRDF